MACEVPWTADLSCDPGWVEHPPEDRARALALAWDTLRLLTGGRVGSCEVEDRPCVRSRCAPCGEGWMHPQVVDGQWVNTVCGGSGCSCDPVEEVLLPGAGIVNDVYVDGALLDPSSWRVDVSNRLVRTDGEAWPVCTNPHAAFDAPGSFSVFYVPGIDPGPSGLLAAGVLAMEYVKACAGGKCRLPSTVTSVVRQGVSMTMTEGVFAGGVTGLREVDMWVATVNPHRLVTPARVWSPDITGHRYLSSSNAWIPT